MWYFAYGSNMSREQIENRVQRVGLRWLTGSVDGYALRFNKKSATDHSGKANIVPSKGEKIWGVVFELNKEEFERLAAYEGGYSQKTVEVTIPGRGRKIRAQTFLADANKPDIPPTAAYLQLILEGACQHWLPMDHCQGLATVRTKEQRSA